MEICLSDELRSRADRTDRSMLNPRFTFDNFVVGPSTRFAHGAALGAAQSPGVLYNPLFIYGNSGLGKTHLLLAIGQYIRKENPQTNLIFIKAEEFSLYFRPYTRNTTVWEDALQQKGAFLDPWQNPEDPALMATACDNAQKIIEDAIANE